MGDFHSTKHAFRTVLSTLIENYERDLCDEKIIELRKFMFYFLLESYSALTNEGDCLPTDIKLGAYGDKWLKLEVIEGIKINRMKVEAILKNIKGIKKPLDPSPTKISIGNNMIDFENEKSSSFYYYSDIDKITITGEVIDQ